MDAERDKLVRDHLWIPSVVSLEFMATEHTRDDFIAAGNLGLLMAAGSFNKSKNMKFSTYAYIRVRGEIQEFIRDWKWRKRSTSQAEISLVATEDDIAQTWPDDMPGPEERAVQSYSALVVRRAVSKLTDVQKEAIVLRFWHGLTLKEIGSRRGVVESAVHHATSAGFTSLRQQLNGEL